MLIGLVGLLLLIQLASFFPEEDKDFSPNLAKSSCSFAVGYDYCFDKIIKTGRNITGKQVMNEYTLTLDTAKHLALLPVCRGYVLTVD